MADEPAKPDAKAKPKAAFDPFKPDEPVIPGVSHGPQATKTFDFKAGFKIDVRNPKVLAAGGGAALLLIVLFVWAMSGSDPAPAAQQAAPTSAPVAEKASTAPVSPAMLELAALPAQVATTIELNKPWAAKKFYFRHGTQRVPAMLVRLPTGSAFNPESYWAFSLQAPFGRCELEWVTDRKRIVDEFKYAARTPMVVDTCTQSLFDPLKHGQIGGAYARGEVVRGSSLRPPLAIDLNVQGKSIIATRME